jgi:hypothetical protein
MPAAPSRQRSPAITGEVGECAAVLGGCLERGDDRPLDLANCCSFAYRVDVEPVMSTSNSEYTPSSGGALAQQAGSGLLIHSVIEHGSSRWTGAALKGLEGARLSLAAT